MNTVSKFLISLFALAYLTFMGFGVSLTVMMEEHGMVQSHCPFMPGESGMCAMNLLDHLQGWQAATVAIPEMAVFVFLACVLLVVCTSAAVYLFAYKKISPHAVDPPWRMFHPLQRAITSGILQPKLF